MPWRYPVKDGSYPAGYELPKVMADRVALGAPEVVAYAKAKRKELSLIREGILAAQKQCRREDRESARTLSDMGADLMKQCRGWDFALRWIEGEPAIVNWRRPNIQEAIAPYVDAAFNELDLIC